MESSKEIRKLFYQDSYEKKKIGANVFKRASAGTERAGVAGGIIFPKHNFKRYEKNSKVKQKNIYKDIVNIKLFNTFSNNKKKELLEVWMQKYTNKEIYEGLGISENRYYELRNKLNVERGKIVRASSEEMNSYKSGDIKPYIFKALPDDQKFEIVDYLNKVKGMTNKKIAEMLDYNINSFATQKSNWKKSYKERGESSMAGFDDSFLISSDDLNESIKPKEDKKEEKKQVAVMEDKKVSIDNITNMNGNQSNLLQFNLTGLYSGKDIKSALNGLTIILNDEKEYDVKLIIKEK